MFEITIDNRSRFWYSSCILINVETIGRCIIGLDQYAFVREQGEEKEGVEFAYWRKHNRLQGWMNNLWNEKTGGEETFNCVDLPLTLEDLDELEEAINKMDLPETIGFFYGSDSYDSYENYYKEDDQKFIKQARDFINEGKQVYYTCWW